MCQEGGGSACEGEGIHKVGGREGFKVSQPACVVLNRHPDNFFIENEQLAFCPALVVPGRGWGVHVCMCGCV